LRINWAPANLRLEPFSFLKIVFLLAKICYTFTTDFKVRASEISKMRVQRNPPTLPSAAPKQSGIFQKMISSCAVKIHHLENCESKIIASLRSVTSSCLGFGKKFFIMILERSSVSFFSCFQVDFS